MINDPNEPQRVIVCTLVLALLVAAFGAFGKLMAGGV